MQLLLHPPHHTHTHPLRWISPVTASVVMFPMWRVCSTWTDLGKRSSGPVSVYLSFPVSVHLSFSVNIVRSLPEYTVPQACYSKYA